MAISLVPMLGILLVGLGLGLIFGVLAGFSSAQQAASMGTNTSLNAQKASAPSPPSSSSDALHLSNDELKALILMTPAGSPQRIEVVRIWLQRNPQSKAPEATTPPTESSPA